MQWLDRDICMSSLDCHFLKHADDPDLLGIGTGKDSGANSAIEHSTVFHDHDRKENAILEQLIQELDREMDMSSMACHFLQYTNDPDLGEVTGSTVG